MCGRSNTLTVRPGRPTASPRVIGSGAPSRVKKLVGITPVPASGSPFDDAGWTLFSGAAENSANRYAIIDFTTGNRLSPAWINQMVANSLASTAKAAFAS